MVQHLTKSGGAFGCKIKMEASYMKIVLAKQLF
jgi:hypothetical protein